MDLPSRDIKNDIYRELVQLTEHAQIINIRVDTEAQYWNEIRAYASIIKSNLLDDIETDEYIDTTYEEHYIRCGKYPIGWFGSFLHRLNHKFKWTKKIKFLRCRYTEIGTTVSFPTIKVEKRKVIYVKDDVIRREATQYPAVKLYD